MAWNTVTNDSHSWTTQVGSAHTWGSQENVSAATRLNRLFPQAEDSAGDVDFIWRIRSDGPFYVATGNRVHIKSTITVGV